ncbi:transcription initiation factor TFIIB [Halarchaeum rubridurum]|uniref:Transcription initiation factor IIB n=1 Tax=Halarchaeum rubridurum TaxID=489911 RepID=A0A830FYC5_9EURY|nr:TFIIB-type zinc ribbon-containing protein [Halarchaeum rubridurum]MBP1953288.1 transcription initiation factor TFIIB [Halarchaeum rubridurum]GGM66413.1 transcription initiation factor IIB [Halarchaeum rubridurum]
MSSRIYERQFDEDDGQTLPTDPGCPECGGDTVTDGGETACVECGLVVEEYRIDHRGRRDGFDEEATIERTGPPLTEARHDRGLSSEIGWQRDAHGNTLTSRKRRQIARLRTQQRRGRFASRAERDLAHAFGEIARLVAAVDLSRAVRESACALYRRAQNENLIRGRSIEGVAAAAVYAACRQDGVVLSPTDLAAVSSCTVREVRRTYGVLNTELALATPIVDAAGFLPRIAAACDVSADVQQRARELVEKAREAGYVNGRSQAGVAAGCLYLASIEAGRRVTQARLANAADVSTATLRSRLKEIRDLEA